MVVAFQEQRPGQDGEVAANLERHVEHYRKRLDKVTRGLSKTEAWQGCGVHLYQQASCLLWGDYDYATFYIGDDLESIAGISMGCDAIAQEFLFGSPYALKGREEECHQAVAGLFLREKAKRRPLISVTRLKLGDHLICAGIEIRRAIVREVYRLADESDGAVVPIVLRCWAWPELVIILLGDKPTPMVETICQIEQLNLETLIDRESTLKSALYDALDHRTPYWMLNLWVHGYKNDEDDQDQEVVKQEVVKRPSPRDPESLLGHLKKRHPIVASRTQLGILREGWETTRLRRRPENLDEVIAHAFFPYFLDQVERTNTQDMALLAEIGEQRRLELDALKKLSDDGKSPFRATITIQLKPGHLAIVRRFADGLRRALRGLPPRPKEERSTLDPELEHDRTSEILGGNVGQLTVLRLSFEVYPDQHGFFNLLRVSHSFRVCDYVRRHLLAISTQIDWPETHLLSACSLGEPESNHKSSGYGLFREASPVAALDWEWLEQRLHRIGRVEGLAMRSWTNAVSRITTRPEMFGAMIEVYRVVQAVRSEIFKSAVSESHRGTSTDPPADDTQKHRDMIADAALGLGAHIQNAYQQRLQFSPVMSGAPPINGQLPYGVNQIVRMVDGVVSIILQAAFLNPENPLCENHDLPGRTSLIVFTPESSIAMEHHLDFGVTHLSLLQAWTPLGLCLIFHELGHHIVQNHFRMLSGGNYAEFDQLEANWFRARDRVVETILPKLDETLRIKPEDDIPRKWKYRLHTFLEDIFAHAVWRRIGCGSSEEAWGIFVEQFLAGAGMRLRTAPSKLISPEAALEFWAGCITQLIIQRALFECDDDASCFQESHSCEANRENLLHAWVSGKTVGVVDGILFRVHEYCVGEIYYYRAACPDSGFHSAETPEESNLEALKILSNNLLNQWRPIIKAVVDCPSDRDGQDDYLNILGNFLAEMRAIASHLEEVHLRERAENPVYSGLRQRTHQGISVTKAPWNAISSHQPGGYPTATAVLWVREILAGVTLQFRDARKSSGCVSIRRNERMEFDGPADGRPAKGYYVDFIGGLFVAGIDERKGYLSNRLAAIESLGAIANRVLTSSIGLRFERSRHYHRMRLTGDPVSLDIVHTDRRRKARRNVRAEVFDISPVGLGIMVDPEDGVLFKKGDPVEVPDHRGAVVHTSVVHSSVVHGAAPPDGGPMWHIGLKIEPETSDPPSLAHDDDEFFMLPETRPRREILWIKTDQEI